jgi:hypothetical protein
MPSLTDENESEPRALVGHFPKNHALEPTDIAMRLNAAPLARSAYTAAFVRLAACPVVSLCALFLGGSSSRRT